MEIEYHRRRRSRETELIAIPVSNRRSSTYKRLESVLHCGRTSAKGEISVNLPRAAERTQRRRELPVRDLKFRLFPRLRSRRPIHVSLYTNAPNTDLSLTGNDFGISAAQSCKSKSLEIKSGSTAAYDDRGNFLKHARELKRMTEVNETLCEHYTAVSSPRTQMRPKHSVNSGSARRIFETSRAT